MRDNPLADFHRFLSDRLGSDPDTLPQIAAGHAANFLAERLQSAPDIDAAPVDVLLDAIEAAYAGRIAAEHWQLVRKATEADPRFFMHASGFSGWLGSLTDAAAFTGRFAPNSFAEAVSLGLFCHSARMLRDLGVRQRSGPFDWIFFSLPALVHALRDDFRTFMDREFFLPVPPEQRPVPEANRCHHSFYQQRFGIHFMFNHHDMTDPADFAHYERAVTGFRQVFDADHPVLFVLVSKHECKHSDLAELAAAMAGRGGQQHTLVLCLQQVDEAVAAVTPPAVFWQADNLVACQYFTASESDGNRFKLQRDNDRLLAWLQGVYFSPVTSRVSMPV